MTVKEILQNAYSISGQFMSLPVGLRNINNAVYSLAYRYETVPNIKKIEVTITDGEYRIENIIGLRRVMKGDKPFKNYIFQGHILNIPNGEYIFYVYEVPDEVELENDEPDINEQYHSIIELYVASRAPRPYDRELEQEFYMLAEEMDTRLARGRLKNIKLPTRVWR